MVITLTRQRSKGMLKLDELIGRLAQTRPIFHSEADFQHSFAWEFHLCHPTA